jgi:hypothetical protein
MLKNNTSDELNVILIRGNHEVEEQYTKNGFLQELKTKIQNNNINSLVKNFFKYCPSAIILNHLKTRYWLCHGGFPINFLKYNFLKSNSSKSSMFSFFKKTKEPNKSTKSLSSIIVYNSNLPISQIRWNDFSGKDKTDCSKRDGCSEMTFVIGNDDLIKFLNYLNINFIIRGHTDDYSNAILLMENTNKGCFFYMNDKSYINYYEDNKNEANNVLEYKYKGKLNSSSKCDNEIVTINPQKFNKGRIQIDDLKLLPVLTISNNCDNSRMQYSDSYIVISNNISNNNNNNNFIPNNNRTSILSTNTNDDIYGNN